MLNQEILGRQEQLLRAYCTWLYTTTVRHTGKDRFETPDSIMKRFNNLQRGIPHFSKWREESLTIIFH